MSSIFYIESQNHTILKLKFFKNELMDRKYLGLYSLPDLLGIQIDFI
jgi:hypothetical protein